MISSLHHLSIAANDFESAARAYEVLLDRKPVGVSREDGARSAWFAISNVALRIVAPDGPGAGGDAVRARLAQAGEGLWEMVFATDDLARAERVCKRRALDAAKADIETGPQAKGQALLLAERATHGVPVALVQAEALRAEGATIDGLDHVVIGTPNPGRAVELYGGRLGLDMRLDRTNPAWGARLIFFRCGDTIVEIAHVLKGGVADKPDSFGGVSLRAHDIAAACARYAAAGLNVSEVRKGRREGTEVCTVRDGTVGVPTILIGGVKRVFA